MPIENIPPLPMGMPIVDPRTGASSQEFSQWWQQLFGNTQTIDDATSNIELELDALEADLSALTLRVAALEAASGTNHRTVTADVSVLASDSAIFVDATSNDVTVTLPALSERRFRVKRIDASANTVTIDGDGTNIDGAASITLLTQYESVTLAGGGEWWIV